MTRRYLKIFPLLLAPIFFSGCLSTAAAVASIASSAYTLKGIFEESMNKEEYKEKSVQKSNPKSEKLQIGHHKEQNIEETLTYSPSIQSYYAYPVY